jgi:hypothetical protein
MLSSGRKSSAQGISRLLASEEASGALSLSVCDRPVSQSSRKKYQTAAAAPIMPTQ